MYHNGKVVGTNATSIPTMILAFHVTLPGLTALQPRNASGLASPAFTTGSPATRLGRSAEKHRFCRQVNSVKKAKRMGDRSPKSNQKKSSQKESKASSAANKKKDAVVAKQAATKKK